MHPSLPLLSHVLRLFDSRDRQPKTGVLARELSTSSAHRYSWIQERFRIFGLCALELCQLLSTFENRVIATMVHRSVFVWNFLLPSRDLNSLLVGLICSTFLLRKGESWWWRCDGRIKGEVERFRICISKNNSNHGSWASKTPAAGAVSRGKGDSLWRIAWLCTIRDYQRVLPMPAGKCIQKSYDGRYQRGARKSMPRPGSTGPNGECRPLLPSTQQYDTQISRLLLHILLFLLELHSCQYLGTWSQRTTVCI